ncbi:MAG: hypothetical protein B6I17_02805 [Tenericutes bacterium 4572_104]|nr:MAG: hypothetical protein B6I17_02805 [Tenericutes bacterium 4572_104]
MSELINNNSKTRQKQLKDLIKEIHLGLSLDKAKVKFKKEFGSISTDEIVKLEQSLIDEGMKIEEVQKLCDVHAALFNGSIDDIHKTKSIMDIPGHPANVFKNENIRILEVIEEEIKPFLNKKDDMSYLMLRIGLERLSQVSNHYSRKEYLFFPGLEKKGITSVPKVMWGIDDEIRGMFKEVLDKLNKPISDLNNIYQEIDLLIEKVSDMVIKEENILLPKLEETLSYYDWILADKGSDELGYFLEKPKVSWAKESPKEEIKDDDFTDGSDIKFDAGALNSNEINAIFNTLPLDMTFVDKEGKVKYFSQGKERIFQRPITIIGRHVSMCHPPKSVHIVEAIVNSFITGEKDYEDFYIHMGDVYAYIRYFAVRDKDGNYLGTLEMTQNIAPIQALSGEKRLVSE